MARPCGFPVIILSTEGALRGPVCRTHDSGEDRFSHTLEGAGGLQAVPGSFYTLDAFPGAQSEAGNG